MTQQPLLLGFVFLSSSGLRSFGRNRLPGSVLQVELRCVS